MSPLRIRPSSAGRKIFRFRRGPDYAYISYHKCATRYTTRILREVCRLHGLRASVFDARHGPIAGRTLRRTDFLMLTDYASEMLDPGDLPPRGLYVFRDPRDTLVSMYFAHRHSHPLNHPEIERNRLALEDRDTESGLAWLLEESGFFRRITAELGCWRSNEGFYQTTFERLTADPRAEFSATLAHLGLAVESEILDDILTRHSFSALRQAWAVRHPAAAHNHYRSGVPGEWRTHLVGAARDAFRERHGPLLIQLGYETGLDW